jgi:3',5'-cyclic-AMP phosphodiesterase
MMEPIFSFWVLSDLHFMAYEDSTPVDWVHFLEQELSHIASQKPDFIVINGDLTNGKVRDYRLAASALTQCDMPVYYTMGNHEYYGYYEDEDFTPALAQQRFIKMTGTYDIFYEKIIQGFPFLFLSTENYTPDSNDAGWLSDNQIRWFDERLTAAVSSPLFVFLHHPINNTVAESDDTCMQSDQVRAVLHKHPNVLFFSGHTHCRMDREDQRVQQGSTVFFGGGCMYNEFPQSRRVDVYSDRAVIRLYCHRNHIWLDSFQATVVF